MRFLGLVVFSIFLQEILSVTNITFNNDLIIWLYSDNIVRISHLGNDGNIYPKPGINTSRMIYYIPTMDVEYTINNKSGNTIITTNDIEISIELETNKVSFSDLNNNIILKESNIIYTKTTEPVLNDETYDITLEWEFNDINTLIYGWGSYQNGVLNYRDETVRCVQFNTEICQPSFITNNGYGIYWDNNGATVLNSINNNIDNTKLKMDRSWYNITFDFNANNTGLYSFYIEFNDILLYGDYAKISSNYYWEFIYTSNNGASYTTIDSFGIGYVEMPGSFSIPKILLTKGVSYIFKLNTNNSYKPPIIYYRFESNNFDIMSLYQNYIDYYFVYSKDKTVDGVIKGYRTLTGKPELFALNVYGFWHSQNAFRTQDDVLSHATQYREKEYPVDNIVQDFYYWGNASEWGPQWDPNNYPNPQEMVNELHDLNFQFMVSVWSLYGNLSPFYQELLNDGYLITGTEWLNPYLKDAAPKYYDFIKPSMFDIGVDYIWADSIEPDNFPNHNKVLLTSTNNGSFVNISGDVLVNPYSIYILKSLYDGQANDYPKKRPFCLTRSTYGAQEQYGSAIWTGDISNEWDVLRRQIVGSIHYAFTGNNYWANDIGGFYRYCNSTQNNQMTLDNCYNNIYYHRLMIRWFQFGVFIPIYRVHGYGNTAPFNFGEISTEYTLLMTNLRYRLLPYVYTLGYMVRYNDYTMQRGLIFDFNNQNTINILNNNTLNILEFMFGMNLLITPVYNDNNMTNIYLPSKTNGDIWYDFWKGNTLESNQLMLDYKVPLNEIPIFVYCGSILTLGPFVQYSNQIPWNKLEIRIYKGCNGEFTLYEDDFETKDNVENNQYSLITFKWNDNDSTLNIGNVYGKSSFNNRIFDIVLVKPGYGVGVDVTNTPTVEVLYNGTSVDVKL